MILAIKGGIQSSRFFFTPPFICLFSLSLSLSLSFDFDLDLACQVSVEGTAEVAYIGEETPMKHYIELHGKLEALRQQAMNTSSGSDAGAAATRGPCVVIAGPQDVGKSTLSKILINYCVRSGNNKRSALTSTLNRAGD